MAGGWVPARHLSAHTPALMRYLQQASPLLPKAALLPPLARKAEGKPDPATVAKSFLSFFPSTWGQLGCRIFLHFLRGVSFGPESFPPEAEATRYLQFSTRPVASFNLPLTFLWGSVWVAGVYRRDE